MYSIANGRRIGGDRGTILLASSRVVAGMKLTSLDAVLWALSLGGQLLLAGVLLQRRLYRTFPIFFTYLLFISLTDMAFAVLFRHLSQRGYLLAYFADNVPEFLLELGILVEVAWNILSPVKRSLPRPSLYLFGLMLIGGTILALILSGHSQPAALDRWSQYFVHVNFAVAILRLAIFAAIASFSQMLGIGWGNHVLQIATGFLGYSIVVLLVELLHHFTGVADDSVYHFQEQLRTIGWCMALGYWSYALAKKEAPRKEFSPKMASFLVSLAEVSHGNRALPGRWHRK
jgi:hypothetical protein